MILFDIYSGNALLNRFKFWAHNFNTVLLIVLAGIIWWIPQMWYWYEMTGEWFRYSYTDEGFIYWKAPKVAAVLFDPQNGLFVYSPMALLMVGGLIFNLIKRKDSAPALILILVSSTYLFASWWAWWFGGAFGARSYVELFALLALPLAHLYEKIHAIKKWWIKYAIFGICIFLMYYSVRLSFLYNSLPGPWDGPDWRWNWEMVFWIWRHLFW